MAKKRLSKNLNRHEAPAPQADAPVPSRLQRKITKKAKFLTRVAESKSSALTSVRARIQKKGGHRPRALSMDELAKSLHDVDATAALHSTKQQGALQHMSGHSRGVNRRRAKTLLTETSRLHTVLQHPQYQADPFAAVASHLDATLPPAPTPPPKQKKDPAQAKRDKRRRRKLRAQMQE